MAERMRIAVVAPVAMGVEPGVGESIEQLVWMLTEELVRRGHGVTLFATGDSRTGACADSPAALPEAVARALALDRARIRERAQARFDYRRMVDGYEALYATVATAHPRAAR